MGALKAVVRNGREKAGRLVDMKDIIAGLGSTP